MANPALAADAVPRPPPDSFGSFVAEEHQVILQNFICTNSPTGTDALQVASSRVPAQRWWEIC